MQGRFDTRPGDILFFHPGGRLTGLEDIAPIQKAAPAPEISSAQSPSPFRYPDSDSPRLELVTT